MKTCTIHIENRPKTILGQFVNRKMRARFDRIGSKAGNDRELNIHPQVLLSGAVSGNMGRDRGKNPILLHNLNDTFLNSGKDENQGNDQACSWSVL